MNSEASMKQLKGILSQVHIVLAYI